MTISWNDVKDRNNNFKKIEENKNDVNKEIINLQEINNKSTRENNKITKEKTVKYKKK